MIKSDYIRRKLSYIKSIVEDDSKQQLYNMNTTAEYIFMQVLNDVYGLSLVNANDEKANFPAIDLIDTTKEIVFQVTSEMSTKKVREDTIEKFNELVKQDEYKKYAHYKIKMFYIKEKPNFSKKILEEFAKKGVPKSHILGIEDINGEVISNPDIAQKVFETLRKIFHDVDNDIILNPNLTVKSSTHDSSFVGREDEIKAIDEMLNKSNSLLLINGIGGIGKSSLANHYLYIREKEFDYYGFIERLGSFVSEFRNSLDLKSQKEDELHREIISKLQGIKGKKLLVIDNVEDIEANRELIEMILSLGKYDYKILFTSRRKIKKVKSYPLGTLLPIDAQKLFLSYHETDEVEKVDKIIEYLGLHTLFIKLVTETIENEGYSLDDILEKFKSGELSKIEFIDEESGDELTFNHNLQELFSMQNLKDEYILLLKELAVLPSIDIGLSFLEEILGKERLKGRLNFLVGRGWLIENEGNYKLHEIIKEFLLANHAPCFEEIETISDKIGGFMTGNEDLQIAINNSYHIIYFESLEKVFNQIKRKNRKIATFYISYGNIFRAFNDYSKARYCGIQALKIRRKLLGNTRSTSVAYNNLAETYHSLELYKKAEKLYIKALSIEENEAEQNYKDIATTYNNLGDLYRLMEYYDKSESSHKQALKIRIEKFGEENDYTASSYHNLGLLYEEINRIDEAIKLYSNALKVWEKILHQNHPSLGICYNNVAILYGNQGDFQKAYEFIKKAIEVWEDISFKLSVEHPQLLKAKEGLKIIEKIQQKRLITSSIKIGRNALCPCNSGKKYKKCCGKSK